MPFIHPEPKAKGVLKRWLESKELYWKLRKWQWRRQKNRRRR